MDSSLKDSLTKQKELGRYGEASSGGEGGVKHKPGTRSNIEEEMTLARKCAGCGKDIKKSKIQLACACKRAIYCCEDCQKSSSHKCNEVFNPTGDGATKLLQATQDRYYRDRAAGRGPSSDSIKELSEKIRRNEGRLLSLAEDGDPLAAYLIGSAYLERRVKREKGYEYWNGKDIWPLGHYGRDYFPFTLSGKSIKLIFVYGRPGGADVVQHVVPKERRESNIKFKQGVKIEDNPDFQLIQQEAFSLEGRTAYLVTCKHDKIQAPEEAGQIKKVLNSACLTYHDNMPIYNFKKAGECQPCAQDALQRLRSVAEGQYSISLTQVIPNYGYAARYVTENGVIMQDIFKSYSKPDLRQVLQCLMSNPADLHPLAVAEDPILYWGIIWYWGSVYNAVQDTCNKYTLRKIFGNLGGIKTSDKSGNCARAESGNENVSGLAAFPESAAGEWRIACGNEDCNKVDHKVKFMVCRGCKVRRYCGEVCQAEDWDKHKKFCKAAN